MKTLSTLRQVFTDNLRSIISISTIAPIYEVKYNHFDNALLMHCKSSTYFRADYYHHRLFHDYKHQFSFQIHTNLSQILIIAATLKFFSNQIGVMRLFVQHIPLSNYFIQLTIFISRKVVTFSLSKIVYLDLFEIWCVKHIFGEEIVKFEK